MDSGPLTQRRIAAFWLPLEATWLMMSLEGPFLAAVVARLSEPKENLAAFGVAFSFALILIPALSVLISFERALLVVVRTTGSITWATATEVLTIVAALVVGIMAFDAVGAIAAAIAFVVGRMASTAFLVTPCRRAIGAADPQSGP